MSTAQRKFNPDAQKQNGESPSTSRYKIPKKKVSRNIKEATDHVEQAVEQTLDTTTQNEAEQLRQTISRSRPRQQLVDVRTDGYSKLRLEPTRSPQQRFKSSVRSTGNIPAHSTYAEYKRQIRRMHSI